MASGDYLDLSEHACRAAQLDPSDTTGDLVQAKAKINEAYLSVCHSGDPWDFMEKEGQWSTTAGSDKYTYSSIATGMSVSGASIKEIVSLQNDTDGYPLVSTSWEGLERMAFSTQESSESTSAPTHWSKWGSQNAPTIRLYPSPDAVYTIGTFCYLAAAEMSGSTDTPIIPLAWRHRVLVPYAAALLLEQEGGSEALVASERLMRRHEQALQDMRVAHATAKRPTFNTIQPGLYERQNADFGNWGGGWW